MKHVAFISQHPVFPTVSGNRQRILTLVRAVRALGYDVTFFFISENAEQGEIDAASLRDHKVEFGENKFILIDYQISKIRKVARKILFFWKARKFRQLINAKDKYYSDLDHERSKFYIENLKNFSINNRIDAVFAEYIFTSFAFEAFDEGAIKIIDTHDSFSDRHLKFMHLADPMSAYWLSVPPEEEVRAFRRADVVVAIQEAEAEEFRALLGDASPEVVTVSHVVTIPDQVANYDSADAIFIGSKNTANIESINWFIDKVIPILTSHVSDFRLHVVGSICSAFADHPAVVKHNFLEDLSDVYKFGSITINPTLIGTGINIKLLDAMANGSPTVATNFGVRGLPERFRHGVIASTNDDPEVFAREMLTLIGSRALREAEGRRAREAALAWNREQTENLAAIIDRKK